MALTVKSVPIINNVFLKLGFFLIKTSSHNPADEESPATVEPRLITPLINIVVIITEIAQFGISPIAPVIIGCTAEFCII